MDPSPPHQKCLVGAVGGVELVKLTVQGGDGAVAFAQRGFEVGDLRVFGGQAGGQRGDDAGFGVARLGGGLSVTAPMGRWARMRATRSSRRQMLLRVTPARRDTLLMVMAAFCRRMSRNAFSMRVRTVSLRLRVWAARAFREATVTVVSRCGGRPCVTPSRGHRGS